MGGPLPIVIRPYPHNGAGWRGTQLLIDGQELRQLRQFTLVVPASYDVPVVHAEVLAYGDLDVVIDARVELTVVALPGYELTVETQDTKLVYKVKELTP